MIQLTPTAADRILRAGGAPRTARLQEALDRRRDGLRGAVPRVHVEGNVEFKQRFCRTQNVLGGIEGRGALAGEWIVLGAHYDHLGVARPQFGRAIRRKQIHNGADDNASGTAGVIEIARALSARWSGRDHPRRSVLLAAFTGEELGLLGSAHYVAHPAIGLEKTALMINLDMIGRLRKNRVIVFGAKTGKGLGDVVSQLAGAEDLEVKFGGDGFGPSDHSSFYGKRIPALHFFTGSHEQYHRPTDDWPLINAAGEARVCELVADVIEEVARGGARPQFVAVPMKKMPARGGMKARLGFMPDYASLDQGGLGVQATSPGGPAEQAGMKGGDVIVQVAGKKVSDIYSYMEAMKDARPDVPVKVTIRRADQMLQLTVTPE